MACETTDGKKILAHLESYQDEMVQVLETLVNTDSPGTDKACMDAFAELVAGLWKSVGAKVDILPQEGYGNHVRVEWGSGDETVLILCHMDTVWDKGETKNRPFRIEDGKAYGPGVQDMKAGIVQALFAVKTLIDLDISPNKRITVLHTSDEEIGSFSSRQIIEDEARKSSAVLVLEPSAKGALKTFRKGVGSFFITIQGRAAHAAGLDIERGISAIDEAAHQILYLHGMTNLEEGTTVNVGVVKGGTRTNVVAELCTLGVDVRVKTMDAANSVVTQILNLKPVDPRVTISVEGGLNRPPMERNERNQRLFRVAQKVAKEMGMDLEEAGTGGASDGNFTSALGVPTLDGLGAVGGDAHAVTEYILVSSMPERAALVAGLMLAI